MKIRYFALVSLLALLAACAGPSQRPALTPHPVYKIGNPYEVDGQWYRPHQDYSYDETGIASWYGAAFHGQRTANGEIFNKNELTAAHKTLPLPTLARVTNLENGRSIVVRINDRGPFSGARIIDVSQRAAELLGFENKGTAEVRVQVLADESKAIADAMRHYGSAPTEVAMGEQPPEEGAAPVAPVESKTLEPVRTTPAVHAELLKTMPAPEVVQMPVTPHHIYVQAGAFTVLENATRMQQKLSSLGHATVSNAMVNGRLFYRVRIGPVADVPHADRLLEQVRGAGVPNPRTVVD